MFARLDGSRGSQFDSEPILRVWYAEPQFWCLLLLTTAIFLPRLATLTIRGEESRRAVIAREMIESGDWVVPRTQGVVRLSRPPFQNWMIAATALATGGMSPWAVRLPGFLCTLATVGVIYWYARRRLQPVGALVSGLAYASMLQVLEQGRTGETEPVFTALIASALLIWHGGLSSGWRAGAYWSVGAGLAGLAMLTKGLQAPLYFWGATWAYLILSGQRQRLWARGHALGWLAFCGVVGLWQVPFFLMMGWENSWMIYVSNVAKRFHDNRWSTFLLHLLTYPPTVIAGCLAPWSLLLLIFTDRDARQQIGPRRDMLAFLLIAIAVCFPSVWLPPEARPRYFMPLFPCFAVLIGIATEVLIEVGNLKAIHLWGWFTRLASLAMVLAGLSLLGWAVLGHGHRTPDFNGSLIYAALVLPLGYVMWIQGVAPSWHTVQRGAVLMAAFLGMSYVGPVINDQYARSEHLPEAIAELQEQLPAGERLVSFDHVHHVFLHYFDETVQLLDPPEDLNDVPADINYFCVHVVGSEQPQLPFDWEPVAQLSVDRNHHEVPAESVIVARLVRPAAEGASITAGRTSESSVAR